jgi:CRISPR-associated protein Cmr1
MKEWAAALAEIGAGMQESRLRRPPDYQMVKDHLLGSTLLQTTPPRATFGLPLTFRYSSAKGQTMLVPHDTGRGSNFERHGSLLFIRLAAIGDKLHPLYVRMAGAVPGQDPPAALRKSRRPLRAAQSNAMDAFFDSLGTGKR